MLYAAMTVLMTALAAVALIGWRLSLAQVRFWRRLYQAEIRRTHPTAR